jgi:predicted RNase H-like HicB family nuclease
MPKRSSKPPPLIAYATKVTREGKYWLVEFPDCPGCQTFALSEPELRWIAEEALAGWLETRIAGGEVPPRPTAKHDPRGLAVPVEAILSTRLRRLWDGAASGKDMAAAELGRRGGLKGGKARAASLSKKKRAAIAKKAAKARWATKV